jgi:hypothetical protein
MSRRPPIAALEGPCCAGKTTLGQLLLRNLHGLTVAFVKCYADHAGGGRFLPRQEARSVPEREQALRELLRVEAGRLAPLPSGSNLILADRSVHTLLAHSYALEQMTGIGVFEPSVRLLRGSPLAAWPESEYSDESDHPVRRFSITLGVGGRVSGRRGLFAPACSPPCGSVR